MVSTVSVVSPEVETERNEWRLRRDSYIKRPRAERTVGIIVTCLLVSLSIRLSLPSLSPRSFAFLRGLSSVSLLLLLESVLD